MLFKLAFKNIKKSVSDYAIYFFTLVLGVAIFYVFNAIDSQTAMMKVSESTRDIIDLMLNMLSGVSVFVSFVLGFLIIYASRFLMKRRNKEFGIYMTLGMSKGKISKILVVETFLIGLLSLVVGLVLGCALSQVMSVIVANMFEADLTEFTFVISTNAIIKTIIYFGIMYLLVMIFNTISVSRCKLIDLINANKKTETVKLKNPYLCIVIFVIAVVMLGYAYYQVTGNVENLRETWQIFLPIGLGAVGTFLLFFSLSGLVLRVLQHFKKFYYKGLNSFTIKQFSSKINTTVFSMTVICLMLFVTICVFSSCMSMKNAMTSNLQELAPIDIQLLKTKNIPREFIEEYGYSEQQVNNSYISIEDDLNSVGFNINDYYKDIVDINTYTTNELTVRSTLGSTYEEVYKKYPFMTYDAIEEIVTVSDYNKVAKLLGLDTYTLDSDEYLVIADYDNMVSVRNAALGLNTPITIDGKTYYPKYDKCKDGFLLISNSHINAGVFIVPDSAVSNLTVEEEYLYANYKADTEEEKQEIEDLLLSKSDALLNIGSTIEASTRLSIYEGSVGLGALVTFIGLYLGVIFLISSAAILALKELSEATENKERFKMLRKIGADEKLINKALFRQIAIFFLAPLVIAIIHSIFGIMFCNYILETFGNESLLLAIVLTALLLVVIYGGYLLITYYCSKRIIKE